MARVTTRDLFNFVSATGERLSAGVAFEVPLDEAVTQVFAFLGKRGAGKTYAAGKLVEELLLAGFQVIVVDVVGTWWGLRAGADGTPGTGLDIAILGGEHGDLPIVEGTGEIIGKALANHSTSAVLDLTAFRKGARTKFLTDFAESFYFEKQQNRTPVHVVLEETHKLAPQRVMKGQERMLGAFEDLVRLGRNYGIGVSMLDQRPQSVHKDVLHQAEVLCAFQLIGAHERDSVRRWAESKELPGVKDAFSDLSRLPAGECILWSPEWLKELGRYRVGEKVTFDASATPGTKSAKPPAALRPLDLAMLRAALTRETASKQPSPSRPAIVIPIRDPQIERDRLTAELEVARKETRRVEEQRRALEIWKIETQNVLDQIRLRLSDVQCELTKIRDDLPTPVIKRPDHPAPAPRARSQPEAPAASRTGRPPASDLSGMEHMFLSVLHHCGPLSRAQVLLFANYSAGGGPNKAFATLVERALVAVGNFGSGRPNDLQINDNGISAMGTPLPVLTGYELRDAIMEKLDTMTRAFFEIAVGEYPEPITRKAMVSRASYAPGGGPNKSFAFLIRRGLFVAVGPGSVRLAHELFATGNKEQIQHYLYERGA